MSKQPPPDEIVTPDGFAWVNTTQAGRIAGVLPATIRRWVKEGLVPHLAREVKRPGKRGARRIYVRLDAVRELLRRSRTPDLPASFRPGKRRSG